MAGERGSRGRSRGGGARSLGSLSLSVAGRGGRERARGVKRRTGERKRAGGVMVLASASSTVAGRTCRDHGGLVQPRKRRPHGSNGSRTSSVLFEIPSNFARRLVHHVLHSTRFLRSKVLRF